MDETLALTVGPKSSVGAHRVYYSREKGSGESEFTSRSRSRGPGRQEAVSAGGRAAAGAGGKI